MGFLDAINAAGSSNSILASLVNLNFVVKILRYWYGARPLVILADEVGKSDDEGRVRNRLCQLMDSWAGQVYVVMSALSDYEGTLGMFNKSNREVEFQILPVLGVDTFDKFQSVLTDLDRDSRSNTQKAILRYRIGLAWGATAGYARAVEKLTDHLRSPDGLSSGSVIGSIAKLGELGMDMSLPPRFKAEELEALLQSWESVDCPFQQLSQVIGIMSLRPGMYRGSVLVEPRSFETPQQQTKYLPTVAAWHAASWFETSLHLVQSFPRSQKLWHMMGKAYRAKRAAIESFNDSLAKDPDLATANEHEAQQKLDSFLQKAQDLGINHCGTSPFLVIMAPANCMALDFVIFCPESGSLVAAVQVKSNTLLKYKDFTEQAKNLGKAAKTVRQLNMDFLAVTGAVGVMLAIVKLHDKLPQALKTDCQSFLDIGFNDSLAQDPDLATANKDEARQNLKRFLQKARELGTDHCGSAPFLFIMAPANCMALDFVIFRRESKSLVAAVQVKSNTLLKEKDFREQ
ncbi:unnamed protein product, partial [Symbiodinium sp. KB8]